MLKEGTGRQIFAKCNVSSAELDMIVADVALGVPLELSAHANGVSYAYVQKLLKQGRQDLAQNDLTIASDFLRRICQSQREMAITGLQKIESEQKGHAGAQWGLERKLWRYFSSRYETQELAHDIAELQADISSKMGSSKNGQEKENIEEINE